MVLPGAQIVTVMNGVSASASVGPLGPALTVMVTTLLPLVLPPAPTATAAGCEGAAAPAAAAAEDEEDLHETDANELAHYFPLWELVKVGEGEVRRHE